MHRAVRLIAENVASCSYLVFEGAQEREAHPLSLLSTRPNTRQDGGAFLEMLVSHLLLAGNAVDTDRIDALAADRAALWEQVSNAAFLTLNGGAKRRICADRGRRQAGVSAPATRTRAPRPCRSNGRIDSKLWRCGSSGGPRLPPIPDQRLDQLYRTINNGPICSENRRGHQTEWSLLRRSMESCTSG